jgi:hypothetical protein
MRTTPGDVNIMISLLSVGGIRVLLKTVHYAMMNAEPTKNNFFNEKGDFWCGPPLLELMQQLHQVHEVS